MKANHFQVKGHNSFEFKISYVDIDEKSPMNHHQTHVHQECEVYVNLSGDVVFEVENHIYPISRGSVIITRPYEYHHCIYQSDKQHQHYWILFSTGENKELFRLFFERKRGEGNLLQLDDKALEMFCRLADDLLRKDGSNLERQIAFFQMLRLLEEAKRIEGREEMIGLPEDVLYALQYMDENLSKEITIEELALCGNVSINTLERHFKKYLQDTPFAILRKKRLLYSSELLRYGYSVSQACEESGFLDYSNFIALFGKNFGMTPLQYKKLFLQNLK